MLIKEQILDRIDNLNNEIKSYLDFSILDNPRLWQKFRLEWSYNSNHIEGNTLTYGETMQLLIKGHTVGDHDIREYDEMRAHDLAVAMIKNLSSDSERYITESDIRELNKILLVRTFYKEAITQHGIKTNKKIIPGEYKSLPNHVQLSNGEIFHYAEPEEVPAKMKELLDWYRKDTKDLHPIEVAAILHHRFVLIHPFDDGNGRVARLVMNYELLKHGYPPVIIKSKDKSNYLRALSKADANDIQSFIDYIGQQLIWSMELSLKAAKGETIEEEEDWKKELKLLKQRAKGNESDKAIKKNNKLLKERLDDSIIPLFKAMEIVFSEIDQLFESNKLSIYFGEGDGKRVFRPGVKPLIFEKLFNRLSERNADYIELSSDWQNYLHNGTHVFNTLIGIKVELHDYYYRVILNGTIFSIPSKKYSESITEKEIKSFVNIVGKHIVSNIEKNKV